MKCKTQEEANDIINDKKGKRDAFNVLWKTLGDIPINDKEEIEEDFGPFKKGTDRFEIWHWLEEKYDVCLGDIINDKKREK